MGERERPADRPLRSLVAFWLLAIPVSWGAGMGVVLSTQATVGPRDRARAHDPDFDEKCTNRHVTETRWKGVHLRRRNGHSA